MSLTNSFLIGRSALTASQVALQVTGNNIANVATPGFHRRSALMSTVPGSQFRQGVYLGRGVQIADVRRHIDPALLSRLRASVSQEQAAVVDQSVLAQLESLLGELSDTDLSSDLSKFFNTFSELANNPSSSVTRGLVVEQGAALASHVQRLRGDLIDQRNQIDEQLRFHVERADALTKEIAELNRVIATTEVGSGQEGNLRDQRDNLINELSGLMDITVVEQDNGVTDIHVDSMPVVLGTTARGLELTLESENDTLVAKVQTKIDPEVMTISEGTIGGLLAQRDAAVQETIDDLDSLASNLIFEVNKLHTGGRPPSRLTDTTGWLRIDPADQTLAMNDPNNETFADLPFGPVNGSFHVTITDQQGNQSTTTIYVDLDGIDNTGAPGFGDDTTAEDIRAALDAIPDLTATFNANGQLQLQTANGFDVSFSSDTSGALATLGINTYFQGQDARDIAIRQELRDDPGLLVIGSEDGTNETALAIAGLRERSVEALGGDTLTEMWLNTVERNAVQTSAANSKALAASTVRASLEAQEAAVSGVSLDEEAVNLVQFQQQYQGAARFISVVDELTQILLSLV